MIWLLGLLTALYALFTLTLWWAWHQTPTYQPVRQPELATAGAALPATIPERATPLETARQRSDGTAGASEQGATTFLTVIIPVRNEATTLPHLLADLDRQTYRHFDVIVADDASTDDTPNLVRRYRASAPAAGHPARYALTLLPLADVGAASPKKRAIGQSIAQARGELIVTTDGDCRVGPRWLETLACFYEQTGARLISGPVTFLDNGTVFARLQTVEFASLIGSGAATLALNFPTMCNGANLCYQKRVFAEVGGFAGIEHVASGDDELLMHKIARRYPGGVRFLKSPDATVHTTAHRSLGAFYQQRKRWASKWRAYESWGPSVLAVFVFLSNVAPVAAALGWAGGWWPGAVAAGLILTKGVPEFLYLRSILVFLQKRRAVRWIPATQLIYPFYVLFFGLAAQRKGFRWKGRKLH